MEVTLQAEARPGTGKGVARKLRAAGKVPAVVYGRSSDPIAVAVNGREMQHALQTEAGRNVLIDLKLDGETHLTVAREIQRDPLRGTLRHVDFLVVDRNTAIDVEVSIHLVGESPGAKAGGVLEHQLWTLAIRTLPGSVPDAIEADISGLGIGEQLRVESLTVPEGVEIVTPPEEIVAAVVLPTKPAEETPAEGEEMAEGATAEEASAEAGEDAAEGGSES